MTPAEKQLAALALNLPLSPADKIKRAIAVTLGLTGPIWWALLVWKGWAWFTGPLLHQGPIAYRQALAAVLTIGLLKALILPIPEKEVSNDRLLTVSVLFPLVGLAHLWVLKLVFGGP